jgi:hypothetical protein
VAVLNVLVGAGVCFMASGFKLYFYNPYTYKNIYMKQTARPWTSEFCKWPGNLNYISGVLVSVQVFV